MKKLSMLLALVATVLLAACGGGQEAEGVEFRQVPLASPQASLSTAIIPTATAATATTTMPKVRPPIAAPETTPSVPIATTTDLTISGVAINVNRKTVNIGERNVNLNAFNGSFAANSGDATIQELVYRNPYGGDNYELFSDLRFVDATGNLCPQANCYVNWGPGPEVRVIFTYGWKPTSELQVLALQADMNPTAAIGRKFSFPLIGVQMRQWGKTVQGLVSGKAMEITVGVPLPTITSPIATQLTNATVGNQYNVLNIAASCPAEARMYCAFKSVEIYTDSTDFTYGDGAAVQWISPGVYRVELNHYLSPGQSVTFSFQGVAASNVVYTQGQRFNWNVDGVEVSPLIPDQSVQVINLSSGLG